MHHAKCVPQDNVLIVDALLAVTNPLQKADVGLTRRLWHMSTGRPKLIITIYEIKG